MNASWIPAFFVDIRWYGKRIAYSIDELVKSASVRISDINLNREVLNFSSFPLSVSPFQRRLSVRKL